MVHTAPIRLVRHDGRAEPARFAFTKRGLERLEPGESRRYVYDAECDGLAMMLTPAGKKTFYFARRIEGRYRRVKIGRVPSVSVEQARKIATRHDGKVAEGQNPAEDLRSARAATTLGELSAYYIEHHAKVHKRTWREDERQYNQYLKQWSGRRLGEITRHDIATLHARIGRDNGHYAANRLLAMASKLYTYAASLGYEGAHPCKGVQRFAEQQRERFLDAGELQRFLNAVEAEPNEVFRHYFTVLLFTGGRRENVASMAWSEIDFGREVWTIPGEKFKTGSAVEVPLVKKVMDILNARRVGNAELQSQYVFPSKRLEAKVPHLSEPKNAFSRVCETAGITGLRLHDLRRTVASVATMNGVPYPVVARMVGHKVQGVTGIYARFDLTAVREGFEKTVAVMLAKPKTPKKSKP